MATKKVVMRNEDYREPDSFIYGMDSKWDEFLARWNDPNITSDEAMGLLHIVTDRLYWADTAPERIGEDSRETCVRFLLYYAGHPYKYDREWQIIEKARKVLINKVLNTRYMREEASDELVIDVLTYFIKNITECIKDDNTFYNTEPYRKKIEAFLKMVYKIKSKNKIDELVRKLISLLFGSKNRILVL